MSEETVPGSSSEEITSAETEATPEAPAPKEKKQKPVPPHYKKQIVYRALNGEWDDFAESEAVDKAGFFKVFEREMTKDGDLVSEVEFDADGNEVQKTLNTYNEQGKISKHELYNEGYLAEKLLFEYDDKNRVIKETREFDEGFPLTTHFTYDDNDQVTEKRIDDSEGELQKRETYTYHPVWKTKVVKHNVYDEEDKISIEEETEWEERNGEPKVKKFTVNDRAMGTYRRTEFFDPLKREDNIVYATYNNKEKVVEYMKVVYDEEGRESEEHSVSVNDSDNFIVYYTYDEYSRPVVQEQHQADKIISKIHRRFDEKGHLSLVGVRSFSRGMYVDYFEYELYE